MSIFSGQTSSHLWHIRPSGHYEIALKHTWGISLEGVQGINLTRYLCLVPGFFYNLLFHKKIIQESPLLLIWTTLDIRFFNCDLERHPLLVKNRGTSLVLIIILVSRLDVAVVTFVGFTLASRSLGLMSARFPLWFTTLESLLGWLLHPPCEFQALKFRFLKYLLLIFYIAILG